MAFYTFKIKLLKNLRLNLRLREFERWRGKEVGHYNRLPEYIRINASGHSFVDIGCMWGVNGEYSFLAEEAGAIRVKAVDVFGPTPEFEEKKQARHSSVEFILGDATQPSTIERVGVMEVVFCAGVLYHHPSPFDLLVALRKMCSQKLILRTFTIPEIGGLPNAAVYFPMLDAKARKLWDLSSLGVPRMVGITDSFEPEEGYGNFFWGLTPSCLVSLLETAGFQVVHRAPEAFAQTVICTPVDPPFIHRLPDEEEAVMMGKFVSEAGLARPA
jgi:hypothetical protein